MKTKFGRLAIAAMLLSGSSMVFANDGTSVVGDLPGYGEDAYFGEDAAYTEVPSTSESYDHSDNEYYGDDYYGDEEVAGEVQPVGHTQQSTPRASSRSVMRQASARINRSSAPMQMQPVSHQMMGSGYVDGGYVDGGYSDCGCSDGSCGGGSSCGAEMSCGCGSSGCDGGSGCSTSRRMNGMFNRLHGNTWARMDFLMWFTQGRDTPPLIITSDAGTAPFLPETPADIAANPNNVQTVFGDDINGDMSVGFRTDAGIWLTDNVGVGGRFWALAESEDSFAYNGDGTDMSVGRSFFNTNLGAEDALAVAINGAGDPNLTGEIFAESSLELWAAEAYARLRFGCSDSCQLDFIGGYSHFDINDNLYIGSTSTATSAVGGIAVGDQFSYIDRIETQNTFDGGQIGFDMQMNRGRWMASSLTKVHLGNMNQSLAMNGSTTVTPNGGAGTTTAGGILTGSQPIGHDDAMRDVFAFAPEANFKLGYRFRPNVLLSVGYSFIYFDNVALTGDVIDRNVDSSNFQSNNNDNGFLVDDSSLFVHGIDLGFVIDF